LKTDAALNNLAVKTVAGILAKNPNDQERACGALLSAVLNAMRSLGMTEAHTTGMPRPAALRDVEFRG
jgi:hypothetical protein